jgi:hypothetical protein
MQANETPEAPAPAALTLKLWEVDVQLRDWDRAQFRRYCLVAERAPAADEALFLRYHHNETYAAGEDLQLWGNLGLGALVEITAANENDRCAYDINGVPATRQAYADGLAQTTPELPCDTPPDLLEPVATESATFIFLGLINDVAVGFASFTFGLGGVSLTADGTGLVADDYYLLAYRYATSPTNDLLVVQTLGSVAQPGPDRYQYLLFRLVVARLALLEMTAGGQDSVGYDPARMSAAVEWVDDKARGADSWYKVCPRLVTVPVGGSGAIAACYDATTQFLAGEQLELGGSLPMTSDATTIAALYGTPEPCHCYLNLTTNPVTCAEFDAQ